VILVNPASFKNPHPFVLPFPLPKDKIIQYMVRDDKLFKLHRILKRMRSVLVVFSGGADSAFLLKTAKDILKNNLWAVTVFSDFLPESERRHAVWFAEMVHVPHIIVKYKPGPRVMKNPPNRCYYCKKEGFSHMRDIAREKGIRCVIDGSNADDLKDFRPGKKALRELKIRSPLQEAGMTKSDVRLFSRRLGLRTWNKPSNPCLASRFPYGEIITRKKLRMVEEAEEYMRETGFCGMRVRHHGSAARIEVSEKDIFLLVKNRKKISRKLREIGFSYIAADLDGYRQGALNEVFPWKRKK